MINIDYIDPWTSAVLLRNGEERVFVYILIFVIKYSYAINKDVLVLDFEGEGIGNFIIQSISQKGLNFFHIENFKLQNLC